MMRKLLMIAGLSVGLVLAGCETHSVKNGEIQQGELVESDILKSALRNSVMTMMEEQYKRSGKTEAPPHETVEKITKQLINVGRHFNPEFLYVLPSTEIALAAGKGTNDMQSRILFAGRIALNEDAKPRVASHEVRWLREKYFRNELTLAQTELLAHWADAEWKNHQAEDRIRQRESPAEVLELLDKERRLGLLKIGIQWNSPAAFVAQPVKEIETSPETSTRTAIDCNGVSGLAWNPSGQSFVAATRHQLHRFSFPEMKETHCVKWQAASEGITGMQLIPTSAGLLVLQSGRMVLLDFDSLETKWEVYGPFSDPAGNATHNEVMVAYGGSNDLVIFDAETRAVLGRMPRERFNVLFPTDHNSKKRLLFTCYPTPGKFLCIRDEVVALTHNQKSVDVIPIDRQLEEDVSLPFLSIDSTGNYCRVGDRVFSLETAQGSGRALSKQSKWVFGAEGTLWEVRWTRKNRQLAVSRGDGPELANMVLTPRDPDHPQVADVTAIAPHPTDGRRAIIAHDSQIKLVELEF
ncbi:MAG: hypothetical protein R3C20_06055 [Planctomycetaceae bacterium]